MSPKQSSFERAAAESSPGYLLMRVFRAFRTSMEEAVRPQGFTMPQVAVMFALGQKPGLSTAELARRAFVTPQAMGELLAGLEARGFVIRRAHDSHGRVLPAELTPAGLEARRLCHESLEKTEADMLSGLSTGERQTLGALLERCLAHARGIRSETNGEIAAPSSQLRQLKARRKP